ncbi:hypothetical protein Tco_1103862 [Tanacetum coccineum]
MRRAHNLGGFVSLRDRSLWGVDAFGGERDASLTINRTRPAIREQWHAWRRLVWDQNRTGGGECIWGLDGKIPPEKFSGGGGMAATVVPVAGVLGGEREVRDEYGYIKNHKKTVKNGQARTRESEEYKKKPKDQSRSQICQASVKVNHGQ